MADAEDLGDSEIEPVPVTQPLCDCPECSRTSILDKLKLPTKSDLARKSYFEIITLIAYYARICCYARRCLLCLKLC